MILFIGDKNDLSVLIDFYYSLYRTDARCGISDNNVFHHSSPLSSKTIALLGQLAAQAGSPALFLVQSSHLVTVLP